MTLDFKEEGDVIYLLGEIREDIGSSEYLHQIAGVDISPAPYFELDKEYKLQQCLSELIQSNIIRSAHDISEGGLFVTLCESGFHRGLGFDIQTNKTIRQDAYLFGEAQSRVVVSVARERIKQFEANLQNFAHSELGFITGGKIIINGENWDFIDSWKELYSTAIEKIILNKERADEALGLL
jgi:phosphoribosylformylglycinamidine synthase